MELTKEQKIELFKKAQSSPRDEEARHTLFSYYKEYTEHHVNSILCYSFGLKDETIKSVKEDYTQEAYIQLLNCIEKYDAAKGAKFTTYLYACLEPRILELLNRDGIFYPCENIEDYENTIEAQNQVAFIGDEKKMIEDELSGFLTEAEIKILFITHGIDREQPLINYKRIGKELDMSPYDVRELAESAEDKLKQLALRHGFDGGEV